MQHRVGFAGDGAFRHVDDGQDILSLVLGVAKRRQGIRRLAGLRDEHRQAPFGHGGAAVAELGRDIDLHRNPGQGLEPVFRHQAGVIGRAAGNQGEFRRLRRVEGKVGQGDRTFSRIDEGMKRIADDLGLFVDFLEHEVLIPALADDVAGKLRFPDLAGGFMAVPAMDGDAGRADHRPVAVFQVHDPGRQRRQRQGVGAQVHLAVADADGQRAALARRDHQIVLAGEYNAERERPFEAVERRLRRLGRAFAPFQSEGNQVHHHLGVRIRRELAPGGGQLVAQDLVVLDDAVVDHGDAFGRVGVGVLLVGHAVGGPPGMADAGGAGDGFRLDPAFQVFQLPFGAAALDAAVHQGRDAGRIVTPVFEPFQRVQQRTSDGVLADYADDAAHGRPISRPSFCPSGPSSAWLRPWFAFAAPG